MYWATSHLEAYLYKRGYWASIYLKAYLYKRVYLGSQIFRSLSLQGCLFIPDMFEQPIIRKPFCACLPASKRGAANCREAFLYKRVYWATKYPDACLYKGTVTPNVTEQPVIRSFSVHAYLPIPSRSVEQPVGWMSICTILPIYLPTVLSKQASRVR